MEISIVIPVYNSEAILAELYTRICSALKEHVSFEIILVDDGSKDGSWKKIKRLAAENPYIKGIQLRKNSGQDNALLAGLRASTGNFCLIMDDDLQHNPADILKLYERCKAGADVCYGKFTARKQNSLKIAGSHFNGKMTELLIAKPKDLYLSPFKIINRSTVNEIIRFAGPYPY
nr:glycosyltransferase family 2 protein [Bacteroidota bacterium]